MLVVAKRGKGVNYEERGLRGEARKTEIADGIIQAFQNAYGKVMSWGEMRAIHDSNKRLNRTGWHDNFGKTSKYAQDEEYIFDEYNDVHEYVWPWSPDY